MSQVFLVTAKLNGTFSAVSSHSVAVNTKWYRSGEAGCRASENEGITHIIGWHLFVLIRPHSRPPRAQSRKPLWCADHVCVGFNMGVRKRQIRHLTAEEDGGKSAWRGRQRAYPGRESRELKPDAGGAGEHAGSAGGQVAAVSHGNIALGPDWLCAGALPYAERVCVCATVRSSVLGIKPGWHRMAGRLNSR